MEFICESRPTADLDSSFAAASLVKADAGSVCRRVATSKVHKQLFQLFQST